VASTKAKPRDIIRARKARSRKVQQNLNALQVAVIIKPLPIEILDILIEATDLGLRAITYSEEKNGGRTR
jgi:hypothetical protein